MLLLNNQPIDYFLFSGGEFQLKLPNHIESERVILTWKPIDASEITFLALTVNALKNMGIHDIDLDILYLPYARQDRVCSPGEAHSLEVICKFLDALNLSMIRIWDAHNSQATIDLFENTNVINIRPACIFHRYKLLEHIGERNITLCAPDIGAFGRVLDICAKFELLLPIVLEKERDPSNGNIIKMALSELSQGFIGDDVLIVDDICDGGATFNQAAQILKEHGAANLYLYVTHGIFSKGLDLLQTNFKHIYCHHVLHDDKFKSTDKLTILREFPHVS